MRVISDDDFVAMRRLTTSLPGIDASSIGTRGWRGRYERLADASGVVVLVASAAGDAAQARALCDLLHAAGFSTLSVEAGAPAALDVLVPRLVEALDWLRDSGAGGAALGLFGRGLAAVAALRAAARRPALVAAVVAQDAVLEAVLDDLPRVRAATLLVLGDDDAALLQAQRRALPLLGGARRLEIVPGAGAGRADPVAAQAVGHLAAQWFAQQLPLGHLH